MSTPATNQFSFILKPSEHGVSVFAVHNIAKGTELRLFAGKGKEADHVYRREEVPELFRAYCVERKDHLLGPKDFGAMPVGWYMNHSRNPNAALQDEHFYALRDIGEGAEIVIDYRDLGEPEEAKEDYY